MLLSNQYNLELFFDSSQFVYLFKHILYVNIVLLKLIYNQKNFWKTVLIIDENEKTC